MEGDSSTYGTILADLVDSVHVLHAGCSLNPTAISEVVKPVGTTTQLKIIYPALRTPP
jgi:hypothetical protein